MAAQHRLRSISGVRKTPGNQRKHTTLRAARMLPGPEPTGCVPTRPSDAASGASGRAQGAPASLSSHCRTVPTAVLGLVRVPLLPYGTHCECASATKCSSTGGAGADTECAGATAALRHWHDGGALVPEGSPDDEEWRTTCDFSVDSASGRPARRPHVGGRRDTRYV